MLALLCPTVLFASPKAHASYTFIRQWGSEGSGDGEFSWPDGIAVDAAGNVYVADSANDRIQKFTGAGRFLTKWGSRAIGDGHLYTPLSVAVDAAGNVYAVDEWNFIQKFTAQGVFLDRWLPADGHLYHPGWVTVDATGNVYLADSAYDRVQKFTGEGSLLTSWGSPGSGDGEFAGPHGVAVDTAGHVHVMDTSNFRVEKFTGEGVFLAKWGSPGYGDGQFSIARGLAVDAAGNVYVADRFNHRVQKFTGEGVFLTAWGSEGSGEGEFRQPAGVAVDAAGDVYVTDGENHRVQKFRQLVPELAWTGQPGFVADGVKPNRGTARSTRFLFRVLYRDNRGNLPHFVTLHLRRNRRYFGEFAMVEGRGDYRLGCIYRRSRKLPPGSYEHRFEAQDRHGMALGVPTNWTRGPMVEPGGALALTSVAALPTDLGAQLTFVLSSPARVQARILNIAGRQIRTLCDTKDCKAGTNTLLWNARNDRGLPVANGTYLVQLTANAPDGAQTRALTQVRISR